MAICSVYANYTRKGNDSVSVMNIGFNADGDKDVAMGVVCWMCNNGLLCSPTQSKFVETLIDVQ